MRKADPISHKSKDSRATSMVGEKVRPGGKKLMYHVEIEGLPPTLNQFYSSPHWSKRNQLKNEWREKCFYAIKEALIPKFHAPIIINATQFSRRTPRDVDGTIMGVKFFMDAMIDAGRIEDDGPEYVHTVILQSKKGKENKIVITIQ